MGLPDSDSVSSLFCHFLYRIFQVLLARGGVNSGGVQVRMSHQGCYLFQPHTLIDQIFGEGMAQDVWCQMGQVCRRTNALQDALNRSAGQGRAGFFFDLRSEENTCFWSYSQPVL